MNRDLLASFPVLLATTSLERLLLLSLHIEDQDVGGIEEEADALSD